MTAWPDSAAITAVAVLADGVRRSLFEFVRRAPASVTREEAAAAVGVSRKLAAFHLEKLVDLGLLSSATPADSDGQVGRRPKRYAAGELDLNVAIPARRPDLLARFLVDAIVSERQDESTLDAAVRVGREHGRAAGTRERDSRRPGRLGAERALTFTRALLEALGFEVSHLPADSVRFRSCPYQPLASSEPEVVCQIHHAYLTGLLDGIKAHSIDAVLTSGSAPCCVELRPSNR